MEKRVVYKSKWLAPESIDHSSPMRKVINVYQNDHGYVEELECGHDVQILECYLPAKKRRCKQCGALVNMIVEETDKS